MLGIGFIITHFVAMQKPQQRKYHSSCNRSVHRGTAHGKQRVKVCKRKTPHLFLMRSFLPPCGDKLQFSNNIIDSKIMRLSSPCGDKLQSVREVCTHWRRLRLSSPCGDKLQSRISFSACSMRSRLSSPCGDKLQSGRLNRCIAACGYRPLAGISCNSRTAPKRNSFPAFFKACSAITR